MLVILTGSQGLGQLSFYRLIYGNQIYAAKSKAWQWKNDIMNWPKFKKWPTENHAGSHWFKMYRSISAFQFHWWNSPLDMPDVMHVYINVSLFSHIMADTSSCHWQDKYIRTKSNARCTDNRHLTIYLSFFILKEFVHLSFPFDKLTFWFATRACCCWPSYNYL